MEIFLTNPFHHLHEHNQIHTTNLAADRNKDFRAFEKQVAAKRKDPSLQLTPMPMEGCVVRFADTISYIGRDIEDAIRLGLVRRQELPARSVAVLGDTNGKIVYTLVTDIVTHSMDKDHIAFSEEVSAALRELKRFNYERIYMNRKVKSASGRIQSLFAMLFERYLDDLKVDNRASVIFTHFLKKLIKFIFTTLLNLWRFYYIYMPCTRLYLKR